MKAEFKAKLVDTWLAQGRDTAFFSGLGFVFAIVMSYVGAEPNWKSWVWWVAGWVGINAIGFVLCYHLRWRKMK